MANSWYRNVYLKSEDWRNLRAAMIAVYGPSGECPICREVKESLDVHHLDYRHLWDVASWNLIVVCRDCHNKIHAFIITHPECKVWFFRTRAGRNFRLLFCPVGDLHEDVRAARIVMDIAIERHCSKLRLVKQAKVLGAAKGKLKTRLHFDKTGEYKTFYKGTVLSCVKIAMAAYRGRKGLPPKEISIDILTA